jgi:tetratricopeptide (TPR) repeat protein
VVSGGHSAEQKVRQMKYLIIFSFIILLFSCSTKEPSQHPALPRQIKDNNRSCEFTEADKYPNVDALINDFYKTSDYKDSLELNLRMGVYYYYKQQFDSSLKYELIAKSIDSSDAKINFDLALTYCELKDYSSALISVNKAISICSDKWEYLNSKCYILSMLHKCDESIKYGLISLNMNPENKKIYGNLLRCFDELNQEDSVRKYLTIIENKYGADIEKSEIVSKIKHKYDQKIPH